MKKITLQLLFLTLVFCNVTFGQTGITKGLVGYYKMDEADGETLTNLATGDDIMPDGVIINPVWSDTSVLGTSLYFDLAEKMPDETASYVDFGTYDPAQGGGVFTFSCWYYWNGINGEYSGLTGKRDDWTETTVYWDLTFKRTGEFQFEAVGPNEVKQSVVTTEKPAVRTWQNLTVTYDGAIAMIYLDGKLIKQGEMKLGLKKDAAFMLGCCEPLGVTPFSGHLDEVRYYNRVLTSNEVNQVKKYPSQATASENVSTHCSTVYPNPVIDQLRVSGKDLKNISVYNSTGSMVLSRTVSGKIATIDVSSLKPGIYFLKANGEENVSGKFIKK
jgi:hypothetical protein